MLAFFNVSPFRTLFLLPVPFVLCALSAFPLAAVTFVLGRCCGAIRITRREANRIVKMCEEAGVIADDVRNMTKLFEVPNSKFLEKNMISMGMTKPNYKCAAHHIVAGGSQKSKEARAILRKYGVGINDAANGVYLPIAKNVSNATYHPSMHSDVYYYEVSSRLKQAKSKEDVLSILKEISNELENGEF